MTLILNGTDNSATTPAVTGTDTDTGVYYPAANQVALATNGTLALLVDSSQNVTIGTAAQNLTFQQNTAAGANSTSYPGYIAFTGFGWNTSLGSSPLGVRIGPGGTYTPDLGQVAPGLSISTQNTNGSMTQRMLLNGYGIGLGNGTYPISGTGIKFPATQDASSNANTLDDYEEGTWTPTLSGTVSNPTGTPGGTNVGHYVKVGRAVHIRANITFSAITGGSGDARIGGFPFASAEYWTAFAMGYRGGSTAVQPQASMIENGATHAKFWTSASTSNPQTGVDLTVTVTNMGSSIDWYIEGTYFTS